ncbi:hypothetical protein LINGRAHAP2_LOCUS34639 [Linum grandiflorum]
MVWSSNPRGEQLVEEFFKLPQVFTRRLLLPIFVFVP